MFEQTPALVISRLYKYFLSSQKQRLEKYGLTQQQLVFLLLISESSDGLGMYDLVKELGIDKSNITRTVQALEEKGLVERENTGFKEQKYILRLTEKGMKAAEVIRRDESESVEKFLAVLSGEEQAVLNKIIEKLLNGRNEK